jgi:hypothetical protein
MLIDERNRVVGGVGFDMTAREVIELCRRIPWTAQRQM